MQKPLLKNLKKEYSVELSDLGYVKNYIFDMDGTLINSSEEVLYCLQKACDNLGIKINQEKLNSDLIGPPLEDIFRSFIVDSTDESLINQLTAEFKQIYDYDENDPSFLYENVYDWLISLKKSGKRLFLATNKFSIPTLRLCKKLYLKMFEEIYTIDKCDGKYISKQEMIGEIIEKYNLEKSETIMIGDAPSDIKAAHENGINAVGVLWGYGNEKKQLKELSDFVMDINDLKVLEKI